MRFRERIAPRPGNEVVNRLPPGFHFVESFGGGIVHKLSGLVIKTIRPWPMYFVADKAARFVHQVDSVPKAIFKVYFVAAGDRNSIGDDNHFCSRRLGYLLTADIDVNLAAKSCPIKQHNLGIDLSPLMRKVPDAADVNFIEVPVDGFENDQLNAG